MPILKQATTPTGAALGYHRATDLTIDMVRETAVMRVLSHVDEAAYLADLPHSWTWAVAIPIAGLTADVIRSAERLLIEAGPFIGGQIISDMAGTVEAAKLRRWSYVKDRRGAVEHGGFIFNADRYDSSPAATQKITSAVVLALLAKLNGQPFSIDWTLADNTTRTLDADGMIGVGVALGKHVETAYAKGRTLREAVAAAATDSAVDAVVWE